MAAARRTSPQETAVKTIQGDQGLMPLKDLWQWRETRRISGALKVKHDDRSKTFYLQEGKIVFLTSNNGRRADR